MANEDNTRREMKNAFPQAVPADNDRKDRR
jgi:hypothetical protein